MSAGSAKRSVDGGGLFAARDTAKKDLFSEIGAFLTLHRLDPTPANYTVAHAYVTRSDPMVVTAVEETTGGGVRLSQSGAEIILAKICSRMASAEDDERRLAELTRTINEAHGYLERCAGIIGTSCADAQAYGEALMSEIGELPETGAETDCTMVATLLGLTRSMIGKTRDAENRLHAIANEMHVLRASLADARAQAETDALTTLPNRRAFEARFAELTAAASNVRDVALALCDIDLFKAINDRHGHDVGDRVIRLVGRELIDGLGGTIVARYGGEEFAVLFDGEIGADAACQLDAVRAALSRRSFQVAGTGVALDKLSFSAGVITIQVGEAVRDAVRRADAALYRAKQSGRNRIELG